MATSKRATKKDLKAKITELESKIDIMIAKLEKNATVKQEYDASSSLTTTTKPRGALPKGFESKQKAEKKPEPKPAETPAEKPVEMKKPRGALPKGFESKQAEPDENPAPKPAKTEAKPAAVTIESALEEAYYSAPQTDLHKYHANVTGYTPAANRYYVRLTAPVGTVPTTDWNEQKAKITGYTQPSNQYFATRPRLAYHPPEKRFQSFSGVAMHVKE